MDEDTKELLTVHLIGFCISVPHAVCSLPKVFCMTNDDTFWQLEEPSFLKRKRNFWPGNEVNYSKSRVTQNKNVSIVG